MHWIVQSNLYQEKGIEELLEILSKVGLPHSLHKVVPFVGEIEPDIDPVGKVICIGSYSLRHLAKKKSWNPGIYDIFDQNFIKQRDYWGTRMLNHDAIVGMFCDIPLPTWKEFFVRPVDDSKYFAGSLWCPVEFRIWQERIRALDGSVDVSSLKPDTIVMIASPKEIHVEYRLFVVNGKVVTGSQYKVGSQVKYDEYVPKYVNIFAEQVLAIWQPHKAFVLDIADTLFGLKIVEINTINSAGLYAANVGKLVMALEEMELDER